MRSLALVLCLCTGCDLLFDIHHIGFAPDGQTGSDGGSGSDGGLGPGGCSPITMLADDFTNNDLTTMWPQSSVLGSNVIDVSGGQALIENVTAGSYATLDPGRYYDLRDHYFSARITDNATVDANDYIALNIDSEIAGYGATFIRNATTMTFEEVVPGGAPTKVVAFTYDPIEHAYLRVGVIGGALVFETSQNAITWSRQATVVDGSGFTYVHPFIQTHQGASSPQFTVYVDEVDGGTPTGAACAIARLHDDFSGAKLGDQWARSEMYNGTLALAGGVVHATTTGSNSLVSLGPSTVYDLQNGAISVEIPEVIANGSNNRVSLSVIGGTGDRTAMTENAGMLSANAQISSGSAQIINVPFDPVAMRWWRIANQAAGMTWEVSPDGMHWTVLSAPFPMSGIDRCDIAIAVESSSGTPGEAQFDNVDSP